MKNDNIPIGMCGILKRDSLEYPEIGFAFLPLYNGKGYAYEIATKTLDYAKNSLKIPRIAAITVADNERSIRLLEKIGLRFIKTINAHDTGEELLFYSN